MPALYSLYCLDWDSPIASNRMASLWALLIQSIMALQWSSIMLLHSTTRNHTHYLLVSSFSRWRAPKSKTQNLLLTSWFHPFKSQIQTALKPRRLVSQRTCKELLSQFLTWTSLSTNTMMVLGMQLVNLWTTLGMQGAGMLVCWIMKRLISWLCHCITHIDFSLLLNNPVCEEQVKKKFITSVTLAHGNADKMY